VPLGGTAIGTGINAAPGFAAAAVGHLAALTGLPLREAPDRIASQQSMGDFVALSGGLRGLAVELGKIANDLRLLSSGPHTGLDEIELPALQPGSSIMPGKVNPVVPEMLNMVCFHVMGHDVAITMREARYIVISHSVPFCGYPSETPVRRSILMRNTITSAAAPSAAIADSTGVSNGNFLRSLLRTSERSFGLVTSSNLPNAIALRQCKSLSISST